MADIFLEGTPHYAEWRAAYAEYLREGMDERLVLKQQVALARDSLNSWLHPDNWISGNMPGDWDIVEARNKLDEVLR